MYEYGYSTMILGRLRPTVLGKVDEAGYAAKKAEIDHANKIENMPSDHRGSPSNTTWFIRPAIAPLLHKEESPQ